MNQTTNAVKRPWQFTIIGLLFIFARLAGLIHHLSDRPLEQGRVLISMVRILALVGGIFLLMGQGWAR